MRIIPLADGVSRLDIESYADLLQVRTLPEYRFVTERQVETTVQALAASGFLEEQPAVKSLPMNDGLFDYQAWTVERALDRQRFAIFADTGLGKTFMQLEWARQVATATKGRVLIVAPLNIVRQTIAEADHFYGSNYPLLDLTDRAALEAWLDERPWCIGITNYEKLDHRTEPLPLSGVVLDESSILKQSMGVRRTALIAACKGVPWKLCCSATPAPNDRMEYAEHAYFLDQVRSTREFLAMFFVNRDGEWQVKRHGLRAFHRHLASWSVFMRNPVAYGFEDHDSARPPLTVEYPDVQLTAAQHERARGFESGQPSLLGYGVAGITSRIKMAQIANGFLYNSGKIESEFPSDKPAEVARIATEVHPDDRIIVWVSFDAEGDQLQRLIPGSVHLSGKTQRAHRDEIVEGFAADEPDAPRVLILKPAMFGFGLNLQSCAVQVFSTITDSFERYYQAVRRSWRFGQTRPVTVYIPQTALDEPIIRNVLSKQTEFLADAETQEREYVALLRPRDSTERKAYDVTEQTFLDRADGENWTMVQADCISHMPTMDDESIDLAVFSLPFANLFTYSAELGDMGNVRGDLEYRLQWEFFAERLARVMKPGRQVAIHCMDIIRFAGQHGHRHTYDFPSDVRAGMEAAGFRYRARISIDKNPQIQATRTKDQNLLFVTLKRDALASHPQAGEYVLLFTTPGEAEVPVLAPDITNQEWIRWAHHIWYGIRETDVLNAALGADADDERHICPLQLSLIERCVRLWSNPGETVFSPFAGIGSEGWESLAWNRRFYGVELKRSYFETACRFLAERETQLTSRLFVPEAIS